ncbi:MAG: hypothetical protein CL590_07335 [Alteromonadaceae bacterium]|nr:hypothetical protein [Alteromonadaceae bacterium]|tara:strand:+ start:7816 stop:8214 length:399 start_codon:yes stop_codon:yes gene_type:complete
MSKSPEWLTLALSNLEFFAHNPEYKHEFGHDYIANRCNVSRMTLNRNKKYMKRYKEVREILRGFKPTNPATGPAPISGYKEKLADEKAKTAQLEKDLEELQLRLNDCYQMLEDHGVDPQFIYPTKMKKHKEA